MPTNTNEAPATVIETPVANVSNAKPAKAPKAKRQPKAAKPSKPAASDKLNAERARCLANRAIVQPHYSGPSATSHASRAPKLSEALARVATPIQRAKSPTVRDQSALVLCLKHCDKAGTFCPVEATADLGALSRLASLGFLTVTGNRVQLSKAGASLARLTSKRATN